MVKLAERFEDVALDVDVVLDADGLEVLHASRSTSYDELCTTSEVLVGLGGELSVFVIT